MLQDKDKQMLLSICVPTYNRNEDLAKLNELFIIPALQRYGGLIEVVVSDNSDQNISEINERMLGPKVRYYKNERNLGFAGNLVECILRANGEFVWIISDNDQIIFSGFDEIINNLTSSWCKDVDALMLPFETKKTDGNIDVSNTSRDWGVRSSCSVGQLISQHRLPFVLFSSVVIRNNKSSTEVVRSAFLGNDYIQIALFLEMLDRQSIISFVSRPVICYTPEYHCRFRIMSLSNSMNEIYAYLYERFGLIVDKKRIYGRWLTWMLHHRAGFYVFKDGDKEKWRLISRITRNFNAANAVKVLGLLVPRFIFVPFYAWYKSYKDMKVGCSGFEMHKLIRNAAVNKALFKKNLNKGYGK